APQAGHKAPPEQAHQEATRTLLAARASRLGLALARLLGSLWRLAATIAATGTHLIDRECHRLTHGRLDALTLGRCRPGLGLVVAILGSANAVIGRNAKIHQAT